MKVKELITKLDRYDLEADLSEEDFCNLFGCLTLEQLKERTIVLTPEQIVCQLQNNYKQLDKFWLDMILWMLKFRS